MSYVSELQENKREDDDNGPDDANNYNDNVDGPNDDDDDDDGPEEDDIYSTNETYYNLVRSHGSGSLYTPFAVPLGLSYACSAPSFNNYSNHYYYNGTDVCAVIVLQGMQVGERHGEQ